jgi:subtilase family protein
MLSISWPGGRHRAAVLAAATAAVVLALFVTAGPARADDVRNAQTSVLTAIHAPAAWNLSRGQGVTVAVIDSGVNPGVSDLAGSVTTGPDYTGVHTQESNPNWGVHGTWMASLIAGHGHNGGGSGILGVAPKARVLSIRVITDSKDPGYSRYSREPQSQVQNELADAIKYAVSHHAGVISMSLGYGTPSLQVRQALEDAFSHGVVVVASSGNSGETTSAGSQGNAPYSFPADYPGVIGVAALNQSGGPANFSSANISVQVAAPGVDVPAQGRDGLYWLVSGTSPACALTAGVAALIKSADPHLPADLVRKAITSTTTRDPRGGYNAQVGFGTVDAAAALTEAARLSANPLAGPGGQAGQPSASGVPDGTAQSATSGGSGSKSTASHGTGGLVPASNSSPLTAGISAASHFGGGAAALPPSPVPPRDTQQLLLLCLLAVACLTVVVVTMSQLAHRRVLSAAARPRSRTGPSRTRSARLRPPARPAARGASPVRPGSDSLPSPSSLPGLLPWLDSPANDSPPGTDSPSAIEFLAGASSQTGDWPGGDVRPGSDAPAGGSSPAADGPQPAIDSPPSDPPSAAGSPVIDLPPSDSLPAPDPSDDDLLSDRLWPALTPDPPMPDQPAPLRRHPWSARPPGRHASPRQPGAARGPRE